MLPSDLGLPAKFQGWRSGQLDAIIAAASSEKRFYMLSMPTGGGKSPTYVGMHKLLGGRSIVLTGTKGLQTQLMEDFGAIGMREVKGQNNYKCINDSSTVGPRNLVMCNDGSCHQGIECSLRQSGCFYYDAVKTAADSDLVVTNYRYWMTMNRYADPETLGTFDTLIMDEAHDAPEELADFCTLRFDKEELHALLECELPPLHESQDTWGEWAEYWYQQCKLKHAAAKLRVREAPKYVKLTKQLNDLMGRLFELSRCSDWRRSEPSSPDVRVAGMRTDWVAEPTASGAMFSPVWAHQYAESYLFKGIKRVVLVSATLQPAAGKYLGIPDDEYEFKEMDSTFNPGRRPVIWVPTVKVDRFMLPGSGLEKVWLNRIDGIIGGRLDRKGIVHTRSYDRAKAVEAGSKHGRALYTHGSRNTRDVVDRFKRAKPPAVLVSPSLETGWDFPHEECRYQILAKVPFVDTRSAIVQARAKADKKYLNYLTALSIIQMCGRGMRAEDDFCETFIIDDHWQWFKAAATKQGFFPQWFLRACRKVDGNPPVQRVEDHPIYKVHTGGIKR